MPTGDTQAWDFGPVLDLIDSDSTLVDSPTRQSSTTLPKDGVEDIKKQSLTPDTTNASTTPPPPPISDDALGISLGSFAKLWESMGIKLDHPSDTKNNRKKQDTTTNTLPATFADYVNNHNPLSDRGLQQQLESACKTSLDESLTKELLDAQESSSEGAEDLYPYARTSKPSDNPYAGMTKKQRGKARKKERKALAKNELQKKNNVDGQRVEIKTQLAQSAFTPAKVTDSNSKATQVKQHQQSNVGTKVRPSTPPPSLGPALPEKQYRLATKEEFTALSTPLGNTSTLKQAAQTNRRLSNDLLKLVPTHVPKPETPNNSRFSSLLQGYYPQGSYPPGSQPQSSPLQGSHPPGFHPQGYYPQPQAPRPFPTTLAMNPALAHLNAGLQAQYSTVGTPYSLPPGFQTGFQTPPSWPGQGGLVPSTVQPIPVVSTHTKPKKAAIARTPEDRDFDFLQRLMFRFPEDRKWLVSPMRLTSDKSSPDGVHIFIDASNIQIGFNQTRYSIGLPRSEMSFQHLALLLERRRPVAKRVFSGSTRISAPMPSNEKFNALAGDVGYEKHIFEQVYKTKELTERQKFFRDVDRFGYATAMDMQRSGSSGSDSETGMGASPSKKTTKPQALKWVEQGVDESLHLKMCQSIIDCETPSTMVLATGDGAEAEFSDGFLKHVERALKRGWKVELVSWKQQTNGGYKNKKFRAKWGDMFRIIELDEFMEYMAA